MPALQQALAARAADPTGIAAPATLVTTYFDTPDQALAARGLTLRVRRRDRHFIQTVKSAGSGAVGAGRGEWEDATAGDMPDPQAPNTGSFLTESTQFTPLFRTEIDRRTIELSPGPDTSIEAAIDCGRVYAPERDAGEPVSEVELELKRGSATALYDVALDLLAVAPVRLELRSKAERGFRLLAGDPAPAEAVHAAPVALAPGLSGSEALRRIGTACLGQILRNEAAVLAGEPEGVHQMRVAVRRLRAVLSAFGKLLPAKQRRCASQELRWLADALGAARNLDVFEKALLAPAKSAGVAPSDVPALVEAVARRRKAAYAAARKAIRSTRYTALLLRLLRWFEGCGWRSDAGRHLERPIGALAGKLLDKRRRAVKRRSEGFARQSAKERHKLRIALKKERYTIEMLAALYPPRAVERFVKRLKQLQDDLGDANDVAVGRSLVADLTAQAGDGPIAAAGNSVLDWQEQRLAARQHGLRKHLDRLRDAEPFWKD